MHIDILLLYKKRVGYEIAINMKYIDILLQMLTIALSLIIMGSPTSKNLVSCLMKKNQLK